MKQKLKKAVLMGLLLFLAGAGTGCGSKQEESPANEVSENGEANTQEAAVSELKADTVMMAVGENNVTYEEVQFYLYQLKKRYESTLGSDVWKAKIEGDTSFGSYAKQEIIDELTQLKIIGQKAKEDEVVLSDDEKTEISARTQEFLASVSEEDQKRYNFRKEMVEQIYQENVLAEKMFDITTSSVNTDIPDQDARQTNLAVISLVLDGVDRDGSKVSLTNKEIQAKEKAAQLLLRQWKQAEDPLAFAESESELEPVTVTFGEDAIPEYFGEDGFKLKTGKYSGVIKSEKTLYLLYCINDTDEEATRARKESIIRSKQDEVFGSSYTEWSKNYKVIVSTSLWEQVELGD